MKHQAPSTRHHFTFYSAPTDHPILQADREMGRVVTLRPPRVAVHGSERRMIGDRQTISILQACEQVGVSRRTIYNWMAAGKVEYVRTAGGAVRIFSDSLWRAPETGSRRLQPRPTAVAPDLSES